MIEKLKVLQKVYDFLLWLQPTIQRFAKVYKYSLGQELEKETIALLKQIIKANLERGSKREKIEKCFVHYEVVKILIRLSKDYKLLSLKQYGFACRELVEIGNLLGGWYKRYQ